MKASSGRSRFVSNPLHSKGGIFLKWLQKGNPLGRDKGVTDFQ